MVERWGVFKIISVGDNDIRKKIVERLPDDILYGLVRHPSVVISEYACLGDGTVVMQGAIVQSCARIGNHCIINTAASVDHKGLNPSDKLTTTL